ncbi:hypothetical protein [Pendulispora albinea]|uniref:Uncharacterized protein n=1 Tax=Pendulispora albinea TaxID=2741071 RepID=A0ABZ2M6W4_9BACT
MRPKAPRRLLRDTNPKTSRVRRAFASCALAASALALPLCASSNASAADLAPTAAAAAPTTPVRVVSDRPNTTLLRLSSSGTGYGNGAALVYESFEPLCTAPCTVSVDPNGIYQVAGEGVVPSGKFRMTDRTRMDLRVSAGSTTKRWWGWMLTLFGCSFVALGGSSLLVGSLTGHVSNEVRDKDQAATFRDLGIVGIGTGVTFLAIGITMFVTSATDVTTASGQEVARHAPRPDKPAPSLSLAPLGLVF